MFFFDLETSEFEIAMQNLVVRMSVKQKLSIGYILIICDGMAATIFVIHARHDYKCITRHATRG